MHGLIHRFIKGELISKHTILSLINSHNVYLVNNGRRRCTLELAVEVQKLINKGYQLISIAPESSDTVAKVSRKLRDNSDQQFPSTTSSLSPTSPTSTASTSTSILSMIETTEVEWMCWRKGSRNVSIMRIRTRSKESTLMDRALLEYFRLRAAARPWYYQKMTASDLIFQYIPVVRIESFKERQLVSGKIMLLTEYTQEYYESMFEKLGVAKFPPYSASSPVDSVYNRTIEIKGEWLSRSPASSKWFR